MDIDYNLNYEKMKLVALGLIEYSEFSASDWVDFFNLQYPMMKLGREKAEFLLRWRGCKFVVRSSSACPQNKNVIAISTIKYNYVKNPNISFRRNKKRFIQEKKRGNYQIFHYLAFVKRRANLGKCHCTERLFILNVPLLLGDIMGADGNGHDCTEYCSVCDALYPKIMQKRSQLHIVQHDLKYIVDMTHNCQIFWFSHPCNLS